MKHPNSQELALYVSDDVTPEERDRLLLHLRECAACAADVEALGRSTKRLANWHFPAVQTERIRWARQALRSGIAAALVFGIGFGLARLSTPSVIDPAQLRSEVERSVRASLAADLRRAVEETHAQSQAGLAVLEGRLAKASEEQAAQLARNLASAVKGLREEDRAAFRLLVERLRRDHEREIRQVRADLETVASNADDQLRFARLQLRALSTFSDRNKVKSDTP